MCVCVCALCAVWSRQLKKKEEKEDVQLYEGGGIEGREYRDGDGLLFSSQ